MQHIRRSYFNVAGAAVSEFITYFRVSTHKQGREGLGMEAQRGDVASYLASRQGSVVGEFVEVETGKGADALGKRTQLRAALAAGRKRGAIRVRATLDRLFPQVHLDRKGG